MMLPIVKSPSLIRQFCQETEGAYLQVEHGNYLISYRRQGVIHIRDNTLTYVNEYFTHKHKEVKAIINGILNKITDYYIKYENFQWVVYVKRDVKRAQPEAEQETECQKSR